MIHADVSDGDVPARYWRLGDDGRIVCELCPRRCQLADGQRGLCYVRRREGAELRLTTYGRASGYCIDPIEKKPLNHFLPGTPILSFGTAGCNLTCRFCQNWDISKARDSDRLTSPAKPQDVARAARLAGCRSVAFTYNDPLIFLEYAVDVAAACRDEGLAAVAVTAGYAEPPARAEFFGAMDAANVDLKAFSEAFYHRHCTARLQPVLETLAYIKAETSCWLEVTTLLIPGENNGTAELTALADWFVETLGPDVPLHFSAFHPDHRMLDKPRTPPTTLLKAWRIARDAGIRHVYLGNIHHETLQSSYCSGCAKRVIGRDWHAITEWHVDAEGRCLRCKTRLPGRFEAGHGTWGRRRQAIDLAKVLSRGDLAAE